MDHTLDGSHSIQQRKLKDSQKNEILKKIYYDVKSPTYLSSSAILQDFLRKYHIKINKLYIEEWLKEQSVHTLHKNIKSDQRSQFVSSEIDRMWGADLIDFRNISKFNKGINYVLIVIDFLSKYIWFDILKDKKPQSILNGFKKIFKEKRICKILITDAGREFDNKLFRKFLNAHDIKLYIMRNEVKCAVAERAIRTLKEKIAKHMFITGRNSYVDVLKNIIVNYNNSKHSRTKFKPIDLNKSNQFHAFLNLYKRRIPNKISHFNIGDKVRIQKIKRDFEKGYEIKWSKEIFKIKQKLSTLPQPRYIISDISGSPIIGSFYEFELQQVKNE